MKVLSGVIGRQYKKYIKSQIHLYLLDCSIKNYFYPFLHRSVVCSVDLCYPMVSSKMNMVFL